jgi:hypothetical protein
MATKIKIKKFFVYLFIVLLYIINEYVEKKEKKICNYNFKANFICVLSNNNS